MGNKPPPQFHTDTHTHTHIPLAHAKERPEKLMVGSRLTFPAHLPTPIGKRKCAAQEHAIPVISIHATNAPRPLHMHNQIAQPRSRRGRTRKRQPLLKINASLDGNAFRALSASPQNPQHAANHMLARPPCSVAVCFRMGRWRQVTDWGLCGAWLSI